MGKGRCWGLSKVCGVGCGGVGCEGGEEEEERRGLNGVMLKESSEYC